MDPSFFVAVVSRWVHVGTAVVLIGGLTALRFVVAPVLAGNTAALEAIRQRWKKFVHAGIALFLLSGFVLAVSTEKKLNSGIGAFEFTRARFVRLWPLVAVGAGVAVLRAFTIGMADPVTLLWWLALDLLMIPSLAGVGVVIVLTMGLVTLKPILAAASIGFALGVPAAWAVMRQLSGNAA